MAHILVVDDEEKMRYLLSLMIERSGHRVDQAGNGAEAFEKIENTDYDIVISDIKMPRIDGIELLNLIKQKRLSCPVIFITAFATVDSAVEAMRQGAVDYITKPFEEEKIIMAIERTLNVSRIMAENFSLKQELSQITGQNDEMVYVSKKMADIVQLAAKVAKTDSAVLINGESGTGKELLARFIHNASFRKNKRIVPVNCAAISAGLIESELFGHEKGAFTGADRKNIGKFEFASKGTLFLDEIGDLPLEAQAKLLRALQEKIIQRVGGNREIPVDIRCVCATNRNLDEMVKTEEFRKDLFFRINVFPIRLPPLRDRMEDVIPLANHFLKRFGSTNEQIKFSNGAKNTMMSYTWPGNVRELANVIERSVILMQDNGLITSDTLSFLKIENADKNTATGNADDSDSHFRLAPEGICLESMEKDLVRQALKATNDNQAASARLLGVSRSRFRVLYKQAMGNDA